MDKYSPPCFYQSSFIGLPDFFSIFALNSLNNLKDLRLTLHVNIKYNDCCSMIFNLRHRIPSMYAQPYCSSVVQTKPNFKECNCVCTVHTQRKSSQCFPSFFTVDVKVEIPLKDNSNKKKMLKRFLSLS